MGILSDNPVLEREVRGRLRLRRKSQGGTLPWLAWILGVVIFYFYARGLVGIWHGTRQDAQDFWSLLAYGLLALSVLLAPALSSTAITLEREQQTWDSLATTQLTATEILLGKWLGRQLILWLLLVLAMPYLVGCAIRGEIRLLSVLAVLLFLLVTTAFYSVLGLLCSYQARRTAAATATSLTLTALLCLGTLVVNTVLGYFVSNGFRSPGNSSVMWLNPFFALTALMNWLHIGNSSYPSGYQIDSEPYGTIVAFYLLLTPLLTCAALLFMVSRYRRAVRERS